MLDTNIIVKAIRQKNHPVWKKLLNHINGALCISSITYTELMYGVYHSQDPKKNLSAVYEILSWFQILPFDLATAESAGKIMASLAFRGTPIGDRDMLIAGHALSKKIPIEPITFGNSSGLPDYKLKICWSNTPAFEG